MSTTQPEAPSDRSRVGRSIALCFTALALAIAIAAFWDARDRSPVPESVSGDAFDVVVTQSEVFAATTIWNLPSQSSAFFIGGADVPTLRHSSLQVGNVVGLESSQGLVALALMPPGLGREPSEYLISPLSTAFAAVALHPDITAGDVNTQLARLARVAGHSALPDLAAAVDGVRPIAAWSEGERDLVARIASEASAVVAVPAGCPDEELIDGPLRRCGATLVNASDESVLVADGSGRPCALVPPVSERPTAAALGAIASLIEDGQVDPFDVSPASTSTGTADGAPCGEDAQLVVDGDPDWIPAAIGYRSVADDTVPLARYLGANAGSPMLNDASTAFLVADTRVSSGVMSAPQRFETTIARLVDPSAVSQFGLPPLSPGSSEALGELGMALSGVYR